MFCASQIDSQTDAGFIYDKSAVFITTVKERYSIDNVIHVSCRHNIRHNFLGL